MFANATFKVGISQRVVATLAACAVLLFSAGVYTHNAQAADLASISDLLTDSDLGATSAHTISFIVPTSSALADGDTVTITFDPDTTAFGGIATVVTTDLTVTVNGVTDPHAGFAAGASTISFNSVTAAGGARVVVAIADGKITNPGTEGSYEILVNTGTGGDSGRTRVAILDNVLVSAIVDTVFDFTVTGLATSTSVNGTSTTGSTTPTAINFGQLSAGVIESLAQRLNVTTNARNGFVVTVESDGYLESANGAVIDNFIGTAEVTDTGTTWSSPANNIADDRTWGHWGLTSDDGDLNSLGGYYSGEFGANEFIAASTTPRAVFHHDGPSNGTDANLGEVDVLYQIEITPLQEAADDYNTTLTYIATPTF